VALDCETSYQHNSKLKMQALMRDNSDNVQKPIIPGLDEQSEERLQILSVIMLYLCSGLQATQSNV
jgi:hypothetical protein